MIELTAELQDALVEFLRRNFDVFTWLQGEVPAHVAVHKLFANPNHPPISQKRRKFTPERLKAIEEKVLKIINANVIRESHYPERLVNVVVALKKGDNRESALTSRT